MCLDETAKTMLPKKRIAAPYHFWFPGVLGFGNIFGFRIIGFGFRIILGFRIIGFCFRITRFWLQNHPWFQNHSATVIICSQLRVNTTLQTLKFLNEVNFFSVFPILDGICLPGLPPLRSPAEAWTESKGAF